MIQDIQVSKQISTDFLKYLQKDSRNKKKYSDLNMLNTNFSVTVVSKASWTGLGQDKTWDSFKPSAHIQNF
jgi:hypothetical protein